MEGEGGGCDITGVPESYAQLNFIYKFVNFNISSIVCCIDAHFLKDILGGLDGYNREFM